MKPINHNIILALIGLLFCQDVSANGLFQQEDIAQEARAVTLADTTALKGQKSVAPIYGAKEANSSLQTEFQFTNNTALEHSYNRKVPSNGLEGYYNYILDLEASTKVLETETVDLHLITTIDQNTRHGFRSSMISIDWEGSEHTTLGYSFSLKHTGKNYNPTLEFIMEKNNLVFGNTIDYKWENPASSNIKSHRIGLTSSAVWSYSESLISGASQKVNWEIETRTSNIFTLGLFNKYSRIGGSFNILKDITVYEDSYSSQGISLGYEMGSLGLLKTKIGLTVQELLNSKGYSFSIDPKWAVSKKLDLHTGLNIHHYTFNGDETLHMVLPFVKSTYTLGPKLSWDLFSQYSTETERFVINSKLELALKGGHRLELAYYHNRIAEAAMPFISSPSLKSNVMFMKYSYSF